MEDADPLHVSSKSTPPVSSECTDDKTLKLSIHSPTKGRGDAFGDVSYGHGLSHHRSSNYVSEATENYIQNIENCEQDDGYSGQDCDDDQDDEGLYLALNNIPVKVELEETGDDFKVDNEEEAIDGGLLIDSADGATQLIEGAAGTSGNEACESDVKPKEEQVCPTKAKRRRRRRRRTYFCEEDKLERRKVLARERARKYRSSLTKDQLQTLRERDRERTKKRRLQMTEEESHLTRLKNREQAQVRRLYKKQVKYRNAENLTNEAERALLIREKNRERMRLKRRNMTEEEKIVERQKNRERVRKRREIQRAEALLQKLISAHSDMVKQNPESEHFLQTLMEKEGEDIDQKLLNMNYDRVKELVHSAENNGDDEHVAQNKF